MQTMGAQQAQQNFKTAVAKKLAGSCLASGEQESKVAFLFREAPIASAMDRYDQQAQCVVQRWQRLFTEKEQLILEKAPLRRCISSARPAAYRLPNNCAESSPGSLRLSLEQNVNADLTVVRIHRDTPAHQAARGEGARAFAAAHINFVKARTGQKHRRASASGTRIHQCIEINRKCF